MRDSSTYRAARKEVCRRTARRTNQEFRDLWPYYRMNGTRNGSMIQ